LWAVSTKDGLEILDSETSVNNRISATYIRDQMLSQIQFPKEKDEMLLIWSEDTKNNYAGIREFAKKIASQWLRETFCKDGFCGAQYDIKQLQKDFRKWTCFFEMEYEKYEAALLYAYWLFFSGMALVYAVETINFSKKMKEKFSREEKTSTSLIFFKFLKSYAQTKGISEEVKYVEGNYYEKINEINNCINESKEDTQDIVLAAVRDKLDMIDDCIKTHLTKGRIKQIISLAFPELEDMDEQTQKNALLSVLRAGVAKFYFNQGKGDICTEEIKNALKLYPNNTLAMIQHEKLLKIQHKDSHTEERKKYAVTYKNFKKILKLIEKKDEYKAEDITQNKGRYKGQFIKLPLLQVRIKFDANMELAYLYSKIGDYENADKCYIKLQTELNWKKDDLTDDGYSQLESILLLNRGRNCLDSGDYNSAVEYLEKLLRKGDDVTRDIRSIAHMNLGLAYYASEDNFEKAKVELIKAIKIDPTNSHSYYNLGVLYYMEGSIEKAKKFINKSLYRNIENIDNVENNKDYDKFKETLDRLSEGKNQNLGSGWWQWWFGASKNKDRKNAKENILIYFFSKYGRKIIGIILLLITSALVIKLNYDLYLHDYLNLMYNSTYTIHSHTLSNTDFILLGINIAILLLPVISRLKMADVEIEIQVESKGNQIYQIMPLSNSIMRRDVNLNLDFGLFIIDLWY
jgi:tetratricopeptide (TPR) repeat protein